MSQFDVYLVEGDVGYLLDCQADPLSGLDSRFVVPLLPRSLVPKVVHGLNPFFVVEDDTVLMLTQSASAVPALVLRHPIVSLAEQRYAILNALDMLLTGY